MFVTAFAGSLDLADGRLEVCGAGHNLPLLLTQDGTVRTLRPEHDGMALGIVGAEVYEETRLSLRAGEGLVIYTDGITDALSADAELFSTARLEDCLAGCVRSPAAKIVATVFETVGRFSGDARQEDDMTLRAISRQPWHALRRVSLMPGS